MLRTADAEDVAQETFVRTFVHFDRFDAARPLLPWLIAIARRLCLDRLRKEKVIARLEELPATPRPTPEGQALLREQVSRLEQLLVHLEDGPRQAILLFHLEGLSYRDIASALDVPIGTVMTWLHRGRAQLKSSMENATVQSPGSGQWPPRKGT